MEFCYFHIYRNLIQFRTSIAAGFLLTRAVLHNIGHDLSMTTINVSIASRFKFKVDLQ